MDNDPYLRLTEAAKACGLKPHTLARLATAGVVRSHHPGGMWDRRFRASELRADLDAADPTKAEAQ